MRSTALLPVGVVVAALSCRRAPAPSGPLWVAETPAFTITTLIPAPSTRVGEPLWIKVTIRNLSTVYAAALRPRGWHQFNYLVTTPDGVPVTMTPYGAWGRVNLGSTAGGPLRGLASGAKAAWTIRLDEIFELSRPGDYALDVWKFLYSPADGGPRAFHAPLVHFRRTP